MNQIVRIEVDESELARIQEETQQTLRLYQEAQAFKVNTRDDANDAFVRVNLMAPRIEELNALRKSESRKFKAIMAPYVGIIDKLTATVDTYKTKAREWRTKEALRIAELQRKEDEKRERKEAVIEGKIAAAEDAGDIHIAERLREKAANIPHKIIEVPKVEGAKVKHTWQVEVSDKMSFLKYVVTVEDTVLLAKLLSAIEFKMSPLVDIARTSEGKAEIPGLKFTQVEQLTR